MMTDVNRRRLVLGVVIALVVLAGMAVAGVMALPAILRWVAVTQLAKATGRTVTLEAVELSLYHGRLALRGLRVIDRDGDPLVTLERADVRFSPGALARLRGHVTDATFHTLTVRIVRTGPNEFNVSDLLVRPTGGGGTAPALTIERLALAGGAVVIEDRTLTPPRTWRVDPLALHARDVSTVAGAPPGEATVTAVAAGSPITLAVTDVRLSPPSFKATLSARELDASLAALYLPPASPLTPARGTLTVSATLEHDATDGTHVAVDTELTGVELRRPGQDSAYLTAPAVRVKMENLRVRSGRVDLGRLAVDGGAVVLEDTRLEPVRRWRVDGVALEARDLSSAREAPPGVAMARAATSGARLEVWVANVRLAPLELNATAIVRNVDLSLVRLYLPPELPVRPERGVVNATVRVEHDGRRGTRLGLDAGLSGIELQRPAHYVTAPAARIIADDIRLSGGAVAVGRVTLTSDRLTLEERTARPVRTWAVQNLAAEAKDLSSRRDAVQGVASLRANVGSATASVFVTGARLQPLELRATAILRNLDAALVRFYLPPEVPVQLGRGVVNATLEIGQAEDGTRLTGDATLTGLQAQGRGGLAPFSVTAPSVRVTIADGRREGQALSIGRVELSGAGSLTDARGAAARFDFTRIHVATENLTWPVSAPARVEMSMRFQDRGELDGSGTARLTAPPPAVAWAAELALKFRGVDLRPLAVYVPAADGLGGRVRANVTASLAYAGALTAHVRGDVAGARFALVEGDRTLLSLRSIRASGLDLQWPERMTIKQLRLREPSALVIRDRQGAFPLARLASPRNAEASPPGPAGSTAPAPARRPLPSMAIEEVVVEDGSAAFVDEGVTPAVRVDVPRLHLNVRNVTWPATAPVALVLEGTFPSGGTVKAEGTATAEPLSVDLAIVTQEADLAPLQPYMGFRARVGGRLSANLTVAGPLTPAPRLKIKGDAGLRSLDISDGQRSVITADGLRVTGIDADWPTRIAFDRVRLRRSWALIERDEQGRFLLRTLLERPDTGRPPRPARDPAAPPAPPAPPLDFSFREGIFSGQAATIVDGAMTPPVRIDVAGARLAVRDFSFPQRGPTRVELTSPMPGGGQLEVAGTVQLAPMRLEARAVLDGVAIDPLQQYVPMEGRASGKATGDLKVTLTLDPTAVQVAGQARLQAFRLHDGDRAVVTVGRVETSGIDVDWPRRIAVQSVKLRRPRLLIERDDHGEIRLRRLVTPRWGEVAPARSPRAGPPPDGSNPAPSMATRAAVPAIEIATFGLEKALARFVDYTTNPDYSEELEDVNVTVTPLTSTPGRRTRFAADGRIGGGTFALQGEGAYGDRPVLDMKLEISDYVVPRANPYLDLYTAWMSQSGSLDVTGVYKLSGTQLETRHDLVVAGLEVAPVDERDEVARRVGLPFGLLVSLLKDARGEIRLSLPVAGDIGTREFDYKEAVWAAVRNLSIRLVALPFSKVGSLFFSDDSKMTAVTLAPVFFEPGTDRFGPGMDPHLERVGEFLRGTPAVKVVLEPVLIDADVQALKRAQLVAHLTAPGEGDALERARREHRLRWPERPVPPTLEAIVAELATAETLSPDAMRTLATRRIEAVRQSLTRGGVDAARLPGSARRTPLVEASGTPRVEFDLRS
jgi:hypothetical protein